jgi:hypothetical protein
MSDSKKPPLDDDKLEQLKKEIGIDERVAKKYDRSIRHVEKGLDPILIELIRKYIGQPAP